MRWDQGRPRPSGSRRLHRAAEWLCLLVAPLVVGVSCGDQTSRKRPPQYRELGNGQPAPVDRRLTIVAGDPDGGGPPIGLASSGSICGEELYLADPRQSVVHHVRLNDGIRDRTIGQMGEGPGDLSSPETVIADCARRRLFVADRRGISQYDMDSGRFRNRIPRPSSVAPALGGGVLDGEAVVLPGYWMADRDGWLRRSPSEAFGGASLGYRHDLRSGRGGPLLDLLTEQCRSMSFDCLRVGLDKIDAAGAAWIGCQGDGGEVGVYDRDGHLLRRIDVRSPLFKNDGTIVPAGASIDQKIGWSQRNSTIYSCSAFGRYVATTHVTLEAGGWSPGKAMTPRVLLNVHDVDGTPLVADFALRDLPVARDHRALYVLIFGAAREANGGTRLELDRVPILDEDGEWRFSTTRDR